MGVFSRVRTWILLTWSLVFLVLVLVQISVSGGIGPSDSGGRTAAFALALIAVLPLFVRGLDLHAPRWLPYVVALLSFCIPVGLWTLVHAGRDSLAWSAYGGFQVLREKREFADLNAVLRWMDCGGCAKFDANYGQSLPWLRHLLPGVNLEPLTIPLALMLIVTMSLAIGWLAAKSGALGGGLLLVATFGGAWILLLDRANLDSLAILLPIVALILVTRWNTYLSWSLIAVAIWVVGTWKYYPFALGVLLLPVIRLRRGWIILTAFVTAGAVFMWLNWGAFRKSSSVYDTFVVVSDFPALGRTAITARLVSPSSLISNESAAVGIVVILCLAALTWGLALGRQLKIDDWQPAALAVSGTTLFLITILVAGFGFQYKAAFLLLCAPLLGTLVKGPSKSFIYTSLTCAALIAISCVVGYSILLTSISGLISSSVLLGAALTPVLRYSFASATKGHVASTIDSHCDPSVEAKT